MSDAHAAGQRVGELFGDLSEETAALVRRELRLAREQTAERLQRSAAGIALVGSAAVLGALALGTATAGLVRILDRILPGRSGAIAATLLYGGLAGGFGAIGVQQLRRHAVEASKEAAQTVSDDVQTAYEGAEDGVNRP